MLLDPCNSVLRPGLHSTTAGILSRFQTFYEPQVGTSVSGYALWCPHYVSKTATLYECCFVYNVASGSPASTEPTNTSTIPYGISNTATALAINVGASNFVSGPVCSDFRLLSSCMKMNYTGNVSACAGTVTRVSGLSVDALLHGSATDGPISVNDIFALSGNFDRLPLETLEVRHRPDIGIASAFKSDNNAIIQKGQAGMLASTLTTEAKRFHPTLYGFAWKDVPANSLSISFVQNIEWRPDGQSGIVNPPVRQLEDPGHLAKILHMLDGMYPGWQEAASGFATAAARHLVRVGGQRLLGRVFAPQNLIR